MELYGKKGGDIIVAGNVVAGDDVNIWSHSGRIDVNAAVLANVEVRFETQDINTAGSKAWELAGLSAKPDYATFYLAFTASEATTAAGDLLLLTRYSE